MNKRICLITNWYPTKANPYKGAFFKDQIFAVSDLFKFTVVRYVEKKRISFFTKAIVEDYEEEKNSKVYSFTILIPFYIAIIDLLTDFSVKHFSKRKEIGVGKYISKFHKNYCKKLLIDIFKNNIKDKIDYFYCVDAQSEAFYVMTLAEYFRKPYVVSEHAPFPWPGTVLDNLNKAAIEKANLFLAISNDKIRQLLMQNIKLNHIYYIGNLVDERLFTLKNHANKSKTFVTVASHSFYKNYDLLISVLTKLKEITTISFRIMVVGYAANKGYAQNTVLLERKLINATFSSQLILIPEIQHNKLPKIFNKADAFIMTSIQEGQPVSAIEAACCGLPIYSTRCGGVEDYVDDKIGRVYSIVDVEGMAHGLKEFLEEKVTYDPVLIRETIVSKFGLQSFKKNFCNAFSMVNNFGQD